MKYKIIIVKVMTFYAILELLKDYMIIMLRVSLISQLFLQLCHNFFHYLCSEL